MKNDFAYQLDLGTSLAPPGGSTEDMPIGRLSDIRRFSGRYVTVDTETNGLRWYQGHHPIGLALYSPMPEDGIYIPLHSDFERKAASTFISQWSEDTVVITQNGKFDLHMLNLRPRSMPWRDNWFDTMNMAHIVDSRGARRPDGRWFNPHNESGRFNLNDLSKYYLRDSSKAEFIQVMGKKPQWEWPMRVLSRYAVEDARLTMALACTLGPIIMSRGQGPLLKKVMQFMGVIWDSETAGIQLDTDYMEQVEVVIRRQIVDLELELFSHPRIGGPFKWQSPQVLSHYLFERFGWEKPLNPFSVETKFRTQYNKLSTSAFMLVEKAKHPLGTTVLQLRGLTRLIEFLDQWRDLMDSNCNIHPTFNSARVRTGRLSATDPNTQQLPSDARSALLTSVFQDADELMLFFAETNLRKCFIPRGNNTLLGIDYKQQEIRLFAAISQDENLLRAINTGGDIHAMIANEIWGQKINPWRDWAKVVSFGMLYGMTVGALEYRLERGRDEAHRIMNEYNRAFPRVKPWMKEVVEMMGVRGYATYWSGRRYYRENPVYFYKAVNALVQGGAADMLMYACVDVMDWFEKEGIPGKIINYVHDEVDFEIPLEVLKEIGPELTHRMEAAHLLDLPFLVDTKVGESLGDLQGYTIAA